MLLNYGVQKTVESPLDCKEIKPVHCKGNKFWKFIGRTDTEAETPILWPPDAKNWLIVKDLDAGKGWKREEKGMTEDRMVRWHHRLSGREFEQALGDGEGQGNLACFSPWGRKESDTNNWTDMLMTLKPRPSFLTLYLICVISQPYQNISWVSSLFVDTLFQATIFQLQ